METRASAPPLFRHHVRRPRLTRLLDETTAQAIVITAPAGYGKTTLAAEWLQSKERVVWYRATPASADLAAFSTGIAEAVNPLIPAGGRLRERLRVGVARERQARPLAELLQDDLKRWPDDAWLVIDDYHLVSESAAVEEFVDWLLTLTPTKMLVTTRRRPAWASARRILHGEVAEITQLHLGMTKSEATTVLTGRPIGVVEALVAQAAGWPAVIGMAALATSADLPREHVANALFRYFVEEVVRGQPADVQQFMLSASVAETVTRGLAREILSTDASQGLLESLVRDGLLYEIEVGRYRFHPLVRAFLLQKLRTDGPDAYVNLVEKVVEYARSENEWEEAFDVAATSERFDLATEVASDAATQFLAAGRIETVEKWLKTCGEAGLHSAQLRLARADIALRQARLFEAKALSVDLASQLGDEHDEAAAAWNLAGSSAHLLSDETGALALHRKARVVARSDRDRQAALWGMLVAATELELDEAEHHLQEFGELAADTVDGRLRLWSGEQLLAVRRGRLGGLLDRAEPLLAVIDDSTDPMAKSNFLAILAMAHATAARYDTGRELAHRAFELCRTLGLDFATGVCLGYRANAEIGQRDFRSAKQTVVDLAEIATAQDDPYLEITHATFSLKLRLASGHAQPRSRFTAPSNASRSCRGEYLALLALSAAIEGDMSAADRFARAARAMTGSVEAFAVSEFASVVSEIQARGIRDAARRATGLARSCVDTGYLDGLVLAYRAYPPFLACFSDSSPLAPRLRRLLSATHDEKIGREFGLLPPRPAATNPLSRLTRREGEILQLIGDGLSNGEIAARLYISTSTAKVHVHNILEKLGVDSRLQAALLLRENRVLAGVTPLRLHVPKRRSQRGTSSVEGAKSDDEGCDSHHTRRPAAAGKSRSADTSSSS